MPSGTPDPPRGRYIILVIIDNIRNEAGFRSRDPLRRKSKWTFAAAPSPIANQYCDVETAARRMLAMMGSIEKGLILWREAGCAVRDRNLQQHQSKQQVKPMRRVS